MNSYTSIYIPRMSTHHNEASVKNIMSSYRIGTVERVDFTPINKQPGFGESVDDVVMSAFVHFSDPILGDDNCYNYMSDSYLGHNDFWDDMSDNQPYRLQLARNEYWICLKNKNPVQRSLMNIHQVVENGRYLENLIEQQNKEITNLREIIKIQENKFEGLHQVVYQLIGGLYNQSTQSGVIDVHLNNIGLPGASNTNTSTWGIWPTTRQGDECEQKIKELESYMRERFENPRHAAVTPKFDEIHYNTVDDEDDYDYDNESQETEVQISKNLRDNDSISSHSSMPSLIECSALHDDGDDDYDVDDESVNSYSSMPSLIPFDCYSSDPI
jgi:hypothetical protein